MTTTEPARQHLTVAELIDVLGRLPQDATTTVHTVDGYRLHDDDRLFMVTFNPDGSTK